MTATLPSTAAMYKAFEARDARFDGVFFTGVTTTGIFCRPTCSAKKPREKHVEFFPAASDALIAGYRPCKRCRPTDLSGTPPAWVRPLLEDVARDPDRRWTDASLRDADFEPTRVRRWFRQQYGMTFHAYHRTRRLGLAMRSVRRGASLTGAAYDSGYESLSGFRDAVTRLAGQSAGRASTREVLTVTQLPTPLGMMLAGSTDRGLCLLEFTSQAELPGQLQVIERAMQALVVPGSHDYLEQVSEELTDYFAGHLETFTIPVHLEGTVFQERVWDGLQQIPYGTTTSYEGLARAIGAPGSPRAVGRANASNRVAIVIPCHRVIGRDGRLSGYAGGVWRKRYLLNLEGASLEKGGRS